MKNKKIISLSLLTGCFSLLCGLATGCGASDKEEYDPHKVYLDVWNTFSLPQKVVFDKISNQFAAKMKAQDDVEVVIRDVKQGNYNSLRDQIASDLNRGKTPTIAVAYPDHVAHFMSYETKPGDYMVNLLPLINDPVIGLDKEEDLCAFGVDDYVPSFYDEGIHYEREGVYSLPYEKSTELLFYNKEMIANVISDMENRPDTSLEEVDDYMKSITYGKFLSMLEFMNEHYKDYFGKDVNKNDVHPLFYDSDANMFITQCYQRNVDYISYDRDKGQGNILFNNDGAKDLIKDLRSLHKKGILLTKLTNDTERASDDFKNKKTAFIIGSSGGAAYNDVEGQFSVGVAKVPAYQTYNTETGKYEDIPAERQKYVSQGITLTLFRNSALSDIHNEQKTKYAWRFMKYLTNTENSIEMCLKSNGYVPARLSSYESPDYAEWLSDSESYMGTCANTVINEVDGQYFNYPVFAGSAMVRDNVGELVNKCLRLGDENLDKNINSLFDEYENISKLALVGGNK